MGNGKPPADQWYWADWERDMAEHPLEIGGAWMLILGKTWYGQPRRGEAAKTVSQWARVLRESEEKTIEILTYLRDEGIADISGDVTQRNGKITVISRRQLREWKDKESNRLRQSKFRRNAEGNAKVTPPSSSSSSTTPTKKELIRSFEERFWPVWQKKVDREDALAVWCRLKPSAEVVKTIIADVTKRMASEEWTKEKRQFCPGPAKYLRKKRWMDVLPEEDRWSPEDG